MADEVINGTDLFVFMDDIVVAHATSHSLSTKMTTRNTSNKDSGIYETKDAGRLDISASCEGLMVYGDDAGYQQLMNAYALRLPVKLDFGQKGAGVDTLDEAIWYASGNFLITAFDLAAPDQGNATYNASFEHHDGFTFTPATALTVRGIHIDPLLHDGVTGVAAITSVAGGVGPYTYLWTFGAGGQVAIATNPVAYGMKGTYEGIVYTCTVTDDSIAPITGTFVFTMLSPVS
jgi:hypothetical protein